MNNQIIEAIENRNVIQFYYENELRVVDATLLRYDYRWE